MEEMIARLDTIGWIHFIAAIISLISGTFVVLNTKGTAIHKKVGYVYTFSMIIVIVTSFMIYDLFGGFGIFHFFALVSTFALLGGMIPILKKERTKKNLDQHAEVMGWSVVGLYCAFISESATRLHFDYALIIVGVGCGITCMLGSILIKRARKKYKTLA